MNIQLKSSSNTGNISYDQPLIGQFNDVFPPIMDGVSVCVHNYAHWLHELMGAVKVITPQAPKHVYQEKYEILPYASLPIPGRAPYRLGMPACSPGYRNRLMQYDFGLVHAHCPFSSGKLAMEVSRRQGIPLVATFHSKYRDDFEESIPEWLRPLGLKETLIDRLLKQVVDFYENVDEVWVAQPAVADVLRDYGYKGPIEVVPHGNDFAIDESEYESYRLKARSNLGLQSDEHVLLYVGQHINQKNLPFLIDSLRYVQGKFKMYFIGRGDAEQALKAAVEIYRLQDKVTFVGPVYEREVLKQYYAAADLFLFPSKYDTLGLVIYEAAALHTPSLLLQGSTSSHLVQNNIDGFLAPDNEEAFASCINTLFSNPQKMSEAGLSASRSMAHSWREVVEEVIDRYNALIYRQCKQAHLIKRR